MHWSGVAKSYEIAVEVISSSNVNVGGARRSHYLRGCVSVSVIRPHAYLYLFFLSFWQLNARVFVKNRLLQQLGLRTLNSTVLYEDNKAGILFADHPGDHRRSKHIDTRRHFVRETVVNGEIALVYIPTAEQQADGLTKALLLQTHQMS